MSALVEHSDFGVRKDLFLAFGLLEWDVGVVLSQITRAGRSSSRRTGTSPPKPPGEVAR